MHARPISRRRALTLAIQALKTRRQRIAVDANFHDMYLADYPAAVNAAKERIEINQAIAILEDLAKALA